MNLDLIQQAAAHIRTAQRTVAFTGAGISVESGIPPFRGPDGLWSKYDPSHLDIRYFSAHPAEAWEVIREIFYKYFGQSQPNAAHLALAEMERMGQLDVVITQNIDNLHQAAGSQDVIEFHGNSHRLKCGCTACYQSVPFTDETIATLPPRCAACGAVLKPDFVFFGEPIPFMAQQRAMAETTRADVWLVIGTTGEVYPAALLPVEARRNGKTIIEVNVRPSELTGQITDLFLQGRATEVMSALVTQLRDGA